MAFDLLYLDGHDLRGLPLIERKRALQEVLAKAPAKISYADFVELQDGETVFRTPASSAWRGSSPSAGMHPTARAGRKPGSSSSAPRATRSRSSPLSKNWA